MINPEKHTRHKEFRDYWIRDKLCRELEKEYGLVVDNGRDKNRNKNGQRSLGEKAALIEAHTAQQSFESYAKGHRASILRTLEIATNWKDMHKILAAYGMEIKPHGNGLVIKNRHGKHSMKASALDRSLSQKKLEERFGPYILPGNLAHATEHSRYQAGPLHRSPERGELFTKYRMGIEERKTTLQQVKESEDATLAAIRERWAAKRKEIERMSIAKRNRRNLLQLAKKHEAEALARARIPFQEQRTELRKDVPFTSWNSFLRHESEQGNDVPLAILRSRTGIIKSEQDSQSIRVKDWSQHGKNQFTVNRAEIKAEYASKERNTLENGNLSEKGKKQLLAVLRMEQLAAEEQAAGKMAQVQGSTVAIDSKGTVIFTLSNGGRILDSGKELFFSGDDESSRQVALRYAEKKWGKALHMMENKIVRLERELEKEPIWKQQPDMHR